MERIKAGIIGFGRMAENCHLQRMRECGLYDVVGVCDITPARREAAAAEELKSTASIDEFLDWDIELVCITTHSAQHHADALACAAAGKHMLTEKPIAHNGQQAEEMVAAASENGVVLTVYHNRHFDGDYRMVKAAVREGLLGELATVENRTFGSAPAVGFGIPEYNQEWRITAAAGGGTLLDFGPHWTEQVLDLMDGQKVVQVFGDIRHFKWGDADDHFRIDMVFENGTRATAGKTDISYGGGGGGAKWLIVGTEATLSGPTDDRVTISGPDYELKRSTAVAVEDLHVNIARHIRDGEELIIPAAHALRVMQVIQAGVDSSAAGKSLDVSI